MTVGWSTRLQDAAKALIARGAREIYVFGSAVKGTLLGRPVDLVDLDDDHPIVPYLKTKGELVRLA